MSLPPVPPAQLPEATFAEELRRLPAVGEDAAAELSSQPTLQDHSAAFVKQVARVGKQQMKTAQEVSLLASELQGLGEALRQALRDKEEVIDLLRRERDALATQNDVLLRELLGLTDLFDHALQFAHRSGDRRWIEELERLDKGALRVLERLGLREIGALGTPFDPNLHEVIETVPRGKLKKGAFPEVQVHDVVEVAQRGFYSGGVVLRRARVITAAE